MASTPRNFRPKHLPDRVVLRREYDARRRQTKPWRALYKTPQWQAIRVSVLAAEPLCRRCHMAGFVVEATVVNHEVRHFGDPALFFAGPFEPLCKRCHDSEVQRQERAGEE